MPLKLNCPQCAHPTRLVEPLPLPGTQVQCDGCGQRLVVSYGQGLVERLRAEGLSFQSEESAAAPARRTAERLASAQYRPVPAAPPPPPPGRRAATPGSPPSDPAATERDTRVDHTLAAPTQVPHVPARGDAGVDFDRTIPASRTPYGALPGNVDEPEADGVLRAGLRDPQPDSEPPPPPRADPPRGPRPPRRRRPGGGRAVRAAAVALLLCGVGVALLAAAGYWHFSRDLPTLERLRAYRPPAVTVVYDRNGEILGEIYEQRRYVLPIDDIPEHVQNAFIAAEDAAFWTHGGVDYLGLTRALVNELVTAGGKGQGASTVTMQVTRNFLLSRDKSYERKIKEILLAWRIEAAYDKRHILYLYLNEIYLGSQAYGVEAAARTYFGKGAAELDLAEAAMLAGLPQRPSDYSPHRSYTKAKARQEYVLRQMVANGYATPDEAAAASARDVTIVRRANTFLEQAPHFTEYVRRHLVERYGEERVLNEGLKVWTTCDLELQRAAQQVVSDRVFEIDQRMGFRRAGIETLAGEKAIAAWRGEREQRLRKEWALEQDPAGRAPAPERSVLVPGRVYDAVVLEVQKSWARVGIGATDAIVPIAWSDWVYEPNPARSWRHRKQEDLTWPVDDDRDGTPDGGILRPGDLVSVRVEAERTTEPAVAKAFQGTPGQGKAYVAARLWQVPEVESALLSFDLDTGAVRAMVGGADFTRSQLNRAVQSRRQVGSTFKPIVYAAAIESRRVTAATMIADAPLAFATDRDFIWKPGNYGNDYLGNITLRKALALSRNTATVRVLEAIDPGMNQDVVYRFARRLGIGGPPLDTVGPDWVPSPQNDHLCPWTLEQTDSTICMDHFPPRTDRDTNTRHRLQLAPGDEHWCRSCDMSMGLGSASLSMDELLRAYAVFATHGRLVEPYYVEEVRDRDDVVLEKHVPKEAPQVVSPEVASITRWLLEGVVQGGTAAAANALGLQALAGKTGTTNDEKDAWFVGFTNDTITGVWVGFDQPRPLGVSSTGGRTALPIWMDYMKQAAPKEKDRPFQFKGDVEWARIEEESGRRVTDGGRIYPFLRGTSPEDTGATAGGVTAQDITEL